VFKRLAFALGLSLGLVSIAAAGAAILTVLLTGKLMTLEIEETERGQRTVFKTVSLDELLETMRQARAAGTEEVGDAP